MNLQTLKTAIYCRTALADQSEIDWQREKLRFLANQHSYSNLIYFIDNGESGNNFKRPAFQNMEDAIRAGQIEAVLICDISRIGRDIIGVTKWRNLLNKGKIKLILATE